MGPSFEGLSDELLEHIYTGGLPNVGEWLLVLTSPSLTSTPAAWEVSRVGQGARVRVDSGASWCWGGLTRKHSNTPKPAKTMGPH